jgi:serine/threonine protein kinase
VKIGDFGLSRMAPEHYELATKRKLPVFSMPPESFASREWSKSSDVWSFGILILEVSRFFL